jgi:hypothetical protein
MSFQLVVSWELSLKGRVALHPSLSPTSPNPCTCSLSFSSSFTSSSSFQELEKALHQSNLDLAAETQAKLEFQALANIKPPSQVEFDRR